VEGLEYLICRQTAVADLSTTTVAPVALWSRFRRPESLRPWSKKFARCRVIQPLINGERRCAAVIAVSERVQRRHACTGDPDALVAHSVICSRVNIIPPVRAIRQRPDPGLPGVSVL
jgi:hypothetical protein